MHPSIVFIGLLAIAGGIAGVLTYLGFDPWLALGFGGLSLGAVVQSSYSERIPIGLPGMIAHGSAQPVVDTRLVEPTSGIPFGRAVGQGVADKGAVLGGALTAFAGISVRDVTLAPVTADSAYLDEYIYQSNMGVLTEGDIWVAVKEAVVAGGVVHYDATTGQLGDTGGSGPVPGARWMTTQATIGGLAIVRLSGLQRT